MTSGGVLLEEEKKWCVYMHRNTINNKVYIGITQMPAYKRWGKNGNGYKKNQEVFYRAIQKYGWDNFEHIIWCDGLSQEKAKQWEVRLIALFQTNCCRYKNPEYGYNMTDGGDGTSGFRHTEESIQKMKKPHPSIQGENNIWYGTHLTEEIRDKISERAKERYTIPQNNPFYGKKHSEESINQMKEFARKRWSNPEEKEKIRQIAKERFKNPENNPMYGKHHTEEAKEKMRQAKNGKYVGINNPNYGKGRHVIQLSVQGEYIIEYVSADEAERITEINSANILKCCNHKPHHNTAGGFKWIFKDEYEELNNINGGNK